MYVLPYQGTGTPVLTPGTYEPKSKKVLSHFDSAKEQMQAWPILASPPFCKSQAKRKKHKRPHFPKLDLYINRIVEIEEEKNQKRIREESEERQKREEQSRIEEQQRKEEERKAQTQNEESTKSQSSFTVEHPNQEHQSTEEEDFEEEAYEEEDITEILKQPLQSDFDPCRCLFQLTANIRDTRIRRHFLYLCSQETLLKVEDKKDMFNIFLHDMCEKCSAEKEERSICFYSFAFSGLLEPLQLVDIRNQILPLFFSIFQGQTKNDINNHTCSHFLYFILESFVFKPEHIREFVPIVVDRMIEILNDDLFDLAECIEFTLKSLAFRRLNDRRKIDEIVPLIEKKCQDQGNSYKGTFYRIKNPPKKTQMEDVLCALKIKLNE